LKSAEKFLCDMCHKKSGSAGPTNLEVLLQQIYTMTTNYSLSGRYVGPHRREVLNCWECRTEFSFLNRQHHCRACGEAYCNECLGDTCLPLRPVADLWKEAREKAWRDTPESTRPKECTPDAPSNVWDTVPQKTCPACVRFIMQDSRRSLESALEDAERRHEVAKDMLLDDLNDAKVTLDCVHRPPMHSGLS